MIIKEEFSTIPPKEKILHDGPPKKRFSTMKEESPVSLSIMMKNVKVADTPGTLLFAKKKNGLMIAMIN